MNRSWVNHNLSSFEVQAASFELRVASILQLLIMKDFKKLLIWQKAMEIVAGAYTMADLLPSEEKYGLRLETHCLITVKLGLAKEGQLTSLLAMIDEEQKMLMAFIKSLNV
jgi:hypothetical protein